jgi:ral guanine nucleotide dissociation stimulator-like 1
MKQKKSLNEPMGTVPFLGTFLKDLEYIHAQNPTKNEDGLINFAKKRREFEIIAQIKLLQRAAQFYRIEQDPLFKDWLKTLPSFNEEKK